MNQHQRSSFATLSRALGTAAFAFGAVIGCAPPDSEQGVCFPLPEGAALLKRSPGEEHNGTGLQGSLAGPKDQSASLQGGSVERASANRVGYGSGGMQTQGASLQGGPRDEEDQGTSLQGRRPDEELQGRSLQGHPPEEEGQGRSLQGSRPEGEMQGRGLWGSDPEGEEQGTSYQGRGLQATLLGWSMQGVSLQGALVPEGEEQGAGLQTSTRGDTDQGRSLAGGIGARAYRGLGDLNGARLALAADPTVAVSVQEGQLVATGFADTAALRGTPLVATAPDGRQFRVEVTAASSAGRTRIVELLVDGLPVCEPGTHGMFVPGRWDGLGAHVDDASLLTYSCSNGVIAKCVDWGYAPWTTAAEVHAACTRLARADYCGDGTPWTLDGTTIGVFDRLGVQDAAPGGGFAFEAAWGPSGALCVARTRYAISDADGRSVVPACFASLPTCHSLDEAVALGAVLANQSKGTPIEACE